MGSFSYFHFSFLPEIIADLDFLSFLFIMLNYYLTIFTAYVPLMREIFTAETFVLNPLFQLINECFYLLRIIGTDYVLSFRTGCDKV